ncbi:MAG TPA: DUF5522 domain-containing protein [Pyrinomonadaceae bacterium]
MNDKSASTNLSNDSSGNSSEPPPIEGGDYYLENGLYVFTASFLLRRGYCCDNGCRHCPYPKESNE